MPAFLLRMRRQHVALLFINKVGGSRHGLSIRLSGIFTYPACFWNQGVRIIEVLLYRQIFEVQDQSTKTVKLLHQWVWDIIMYYNYSIWWFFYCLHCAHCRMNVQYTNLTMPCVSLQVCADLANSTLQLSIPTQSLEA